MSYENQNTGRDSHKMYREEYIGNGETCVHRYRSSQNEDKGWNYCNRRSVNRSRSSYGDDDE